MVSKPYIVETLALVTRQIGQLGDYKVRLMTKLYTDIWDRLSGDIHISSQDENCVNVVVIRCSF